MDLDTKLKELAEAGQHKDAVALLDSLLENAAEVKAPQRVSIELLRRRAAAKVVMKEHAGAEADINLALQQCEDPSIEPLIKALVQTELAAIISMADKLEEALEWQKKGTAALVQIRGVADDLTKTELRTYLNMLTASGLPVFEIDRRLAEVGVRRGPPLDANGNPLPVDEIEIDLGKLGVTPQTLEDALAAGTKIAQTDGPEAGLAAVRRHFEQNGAQSAELNELMSKLSGQILGAKADAAAPVAAPAASPAPAPAPAPVAPAPAAAPVPVAPAPAPAPAPEPEPEAEKKGGGLFGMFKKK